MTQLTLRYPPKPIALPAHQPGMRIGLYGGSFDPVHAAHYMVAERARRRLVLDRIWWLVTPGNPLKAHNPSDSLSARIAAIRAGLPARGHDVLGIEAELVSRYSADTISTLMTRCPRVHFVWIMGADNLKGFHRWQAWQRIMESLPVAVIDRPGGEHATLSALAALRYKPFRVDEQDAGMLANRRAPAYTVLRGPKSALASSLLRQQRQAGSQGQPDLPVLKP